jgi:hypothetical protein
MVMDSERCKRIVAAIQMLEHTEMLELFKILHADKCEYTRNNNGVFINLSWLSEDTLTKIERHIAFCTKSQNEVQHYESICDVLNKNIHEYKSNEQDQQAIEKNDAHMFVHMDDSKNDKKPMVNKISSSMRFYLLKKKFSKQTPITTSAKSDLSHETYLIV